MTHEMIDVKFSIDGGLSEHLSLGALVQAGITVEAKRSKDLDQALAETEEEMRGLYAGRQPSEIPGLTPARKLFRSIGADPTRMRPASEALLRRVLKGGRVPAINSAVDSANLVSLRHLIPVGLYDLDRIQGDILLRIGREGESYARIGSDMLNLHGRIGLFDREGGFGNPTGDSQRTMVGEETTSLLFTAFFPAGFESAGIREMMEQAAEKLTRFTGGRSALLGEGGMIET